MSETKDEPIYKKAYDKIHYRLIHVFSKTILISLIVGIISGFMMVLFNTLLITFRLAFSYLPYFIGPLIAGGLTSILVKYGKFRNIMGSGDEQFVTEVTSSELDFKVTPNLFMKTLATSWTFGSGMICGREGPGILIGANIGFLLSKRLNLEREDFVFIGASACVGALLKIPISGPLFVAELPYTNNLNYKALIPSILASTVAYTIYCLFFEFKPLVQIDALSINLEKVNYLLILHLLLAFGVFIGFIILGFTLLLKSFSRITEKLLEPKPGIWILPFIGGIAYSVLLLIVIPLNPNYREFLIGPETSIITVFVYIVGSLTWYVLLIITILFLIGIMCSIGTMNSAGLIMPLIIFGALIGGLFGALFCPEYIELFVLIGMAAALGAATNCPIAAIFMVVEMTWIPLLFVPAGIVTILAYLINSPSSIVHKQQTK